MICEDTEDNGVVVFLLQDSDDEISHLEWETVRVRFVKAALSTDDGELETTYINVFLATYRSFSSPKEVLKLLLQRYEELADGPQNGKPDQHEQHRKTLISALHVWLDSYPEDFRTLPTTRRSVSCSSSARVPPPRSSTPRSARLERYTREAHSDSSWRRLQRSPCGQSPPAGGCTNYQTHFAEQLTRMDVDLFKKLVPHQCLGAVWSRRDKSRSHEAATVLATVNQFNAVSFRVISSILVEPSLKASDRAAIVSTWIDIAQELRLIKNF
ncbi:hypothetical protein NQ318_000755 [Aromia moschata]|uniref:Ral guanine nucleotide dissociation stimulator-like 1 n=1 Tax=Aromia moschata TaxID=1265417 RepID=A0AAV8YUD6_9CUCU|nr:hypothetical protein NQ318_000755 [Aromia moschata]